MSKGKDKHTHICEHACIHRCTKPNSKKKINANCTAIRRGLRGQKKMEKTNITDTAE